MRTLVYSGRTEPDKKMTIRLITTTEGVSFVSISGNGGALVVKPGMAVCIDIGAEFLSIAVPSTPGVLHQNHGIAATATVVISKETEDEVQH